MGRIKTKKIKRASHKIYREHSEALTEDFEQNKQAVLKVAHISSKKLRNIIAGYVTRLKKSKLSTA